MGNVSARWSTTCSVYKVTPALAITPLNLSPSLMSNTTYFPPGVECFHPDGSGGWNKSGYLEENCTVTGDMLTFLNLTVISNYMAAYCLNPAPDDSCPFGFCPQPDIAGV